LSPCVQEVVGKQNSKANGKQRLALEAPPAKKPGKAAENANAEGPGGKTAAGDMVDTEEDDDDEGSSSDDDDDESGDTDDSEEDSEEDDEESELDDEV
jgi:hypothetical protein